MSGKVALFESVRSGQVGVDHHTDFAQQSPVRRRDVLATKLLEASRETVSVLPEARVC